MAQNKTTIAVYPSAARTATPDPSTLLNKFNRGVQVIIDVTAITDTPSVVFVIEGKDQLSGQWYALLTSAAVTAVSTTVLRLEPGATEVANLVEAGQLPRVWRITATHADADSITYSVGANLVI